MTPELCVPSGTLRKPQRIAIAGSTDQGAVLTTVAGTSGISSQIERGQVAEVAEPGNVLKTLFTTLEISQNQYAHRIQLDKSAVSRYLSGMRLPPREFIRRLIAEVEEDRGVPLQLEAKEAIHQQWLVALRVCDPEEHKLETLRAELARSKRDAERAHRNVEALHQLLEQKESDIRGFADEMARLQLDWGSERAVIAQEQVALRRDQESFQATRDSLLGEIKQLKEDLREAEQLRTESEDHSARLREQVLRLEEELSRQQLTGRAADIPLEAFKGQLVRMWEEESFAEATREMTEAAWARPLHEVVGLFNWLMEEGDAEKAKAFVTDVGRLRSIEDVIRFVPALVEARSVSNRRASLTPVEIWATAVAPRLTERNVARFYERLREKGGPYVRVGDRLMTAAVRRTNHPSVVVELLGNVARGADEPGDFPVTMRVVALRFRRDNTFPLAVIAGLASTGAHESARTILDRLANMHGSIRSTQERWEQQVHEGVRQLGDDARTALLSLVAGRNTVADHLFAEALRNGGRGDRRLLDELLAYRPPPSGEPTPQAPGRRPPGALGVTHRFDLPHLFDQSDPEDRPGPDPAPLKPR
jgi:predicted  nucleic acid-binding Zn-ribbon protein